MGLILAMFFGPLILFEFFVLPAFRSGYTPTSFSRWLQTHQNTSLWSQLFFSFTVSLACLVRQYQVSCPYYESATITQVVGIAIISLSLVLATIYRRIERMAVVLFMFLATFVLSVIAVLAPATILKKFNTLTQACSDMSKDRKLPWSPDVMGRYDIKTVFPELLSDIALVSALSAIWCYLWLRRRHWMENEVMVTTQTQKRFFRD
jgi:hypothetical protein